MIRKFNTRRTKRFIRSLTYLAPRSRLIYRVCKMYVDNYNGQNNADMQINGELRLLRRVVLPGKRIVIFDVGANTGQWCQKVLALNSTAEVHCFEPSKATFDLLTQRNFPAHVVCNNMGLGSAPSTERMYSYDSFSERNSLYPDMTREPVQTEQICIDTIDNYCTQHNILQIDFLKIDVEGHDFEVLKGATSLLQNGKIGIAQFEYGKDYIYARTSLRDVFTFIKAFNYQIYKIMPRSILPIRAFDSQLENLENANYLIIRAGLSLS